MSLDLGALVATAMIEDAPFQRSYARIVRQFASLGGQAEKAAAGTAVLDRGLVGTAESANAAAAAMTRAQRSTATQAAAEQKAAAAATRHGEAVARVAALTNPAVATTERLKAAQLRQLVAQERVDALMSTGAATTRQLASANATLISSTRAVGLAQKEAAAGGRAWMGTLASAGKTAVGLGATFGAFEVAKKAIDITKEANNFQRDMTLVQTNADVTAAEVTRASGALLKMAGPVAAAPEGLAVAFYHAKSVGLDYAKAIETTRIAAEGARVGNADLEQTMNALTSTVASGIPGVHNMSSAMGQLIAIVGSGDMKLTDLNAALGSGILTVVKGYGLSLRDVGAALATFGDNNIRGADAATMLRMAVQAMAVPAKAGRKELLNLGLSSSALAHDMQSGGLMKAIHDLKAHLDGAGVSSKQVGAVLTEVFGKRAGPGIAVLVGQTDRLDAKFKVLGDAGASFQSKWQATTHIAAVALAQLGHGAEAAGIALMQKLGPGIATAASWLAHKLPAAIHELMAIITPLAHEVGAVLGGAWQGVVVILRGAVAVLGAVGSTLEHHRTLVTVIATAVVGMWAAYKAFGIAVVAVRAVDMALGRLSARIGAAGGRMAALRGGMGGLSAAAVAGGAALAGVGLIIAGVTMAHEEHARQVALDKASVDAFTAAIDADSGALGKNVRAVTAKQLADEGAFRIAAKLGISQYTLTSAVMGNAAALDVVRGKMKGAGDAGFELQSKAGGLAATLKTATQNSKDVAAATTAVGTSAKNASAGVDQVAVAQKREAATAAAAERASQRLDTALQILAGTLSTSQALDQYRSGLQGLKAQLDKHSHSLRGNTAAAVQNRLAVDGVVQNLFAYADTLKQQRKTQPEIERAMRQQVQGLIANARQYGLNKAQLVAYLRTLGLTPKQIATTMLTKTEIARQRLADLQHRIDAIRQNKVPGLNANSDAAQRKIAALQAQIDALHSKTVYVNVGVSGRGIKGGMHGSGTVQFGFAAGGTVPGVGSGDTVRAALTPGEEVTPKGPATKHRALLKAIAADRVMRYATGGTVRHPGGGPIDKRVMASLQPLVADPPAGPIETVTGVGQVTTGKVGKKTVWIYKGHRYASKTAALNARDADAKKLGGGIIDTATLPGVKGIAHLIKGQTGQARQAMRLLSRAVSDAFTLKGVEKQIADVKQQLATMKSYRSDVMSTLAGGIDTTKAGSVTDLLATLSGGTATNKAYTAELTKLRGEARGNKALTGFINQLAAQGQTATLQTLAGASRSDLAQVSKQVGTYNASLLAGGNAAVLSKYGTSIPDQVAREKRLDHRQAVLIDHIDRLLAGIVRLSGRPAEISINGEPVARAVFHSHEFAGILDELSHQLHYGHHRGHP